MSLPERAQDHPPAVDLFDARRILVAWMQDLAPYGVFTTDPDLVVRSWNQWLATHSGIPAEQMVGRSLLELFPELQTRRLDHYYSGALRGEVAVLSTALHKYLVPLPSPSREFAVEHMLQNARVAPLHRDQQIIGTVTIIEDVTQRELQAAALRRQQEHDRVLSHALALLLQSGHSLDIAAELFPHISVPLKLDVFFNYLVSEDSTELRLHTASGIAPEVRRALLTMPLGENVCGLVAARRAPIVAGRLLSNDAPPSEVVRRLGLRSYACFPLLIGDRVLGTISFGSYVRDEIAPDEIEVLAKLSQYIAIALDRAQREQALHDAQDRLSRHAEELEAKIAERTAKLHETIVQLESFSYTIAHDLRAPIRSLTGFTEILLSDFAPSIPEDGQALLRRLQRASHRLDALTRDLLKFSRIVRQDVKLAPTDLNELVQDILSVTPALQDGVLTIQPPLGAVQAQRTLLQQCLSNLFDNALKFAKPGVHPSILVRTELREHSTPSSHAAGTPAPFIPAVAGVTSNDGARRRIWVEDNGIGIPAHAHERIFGVFERFPGSNAVEGTGIGLAIVARATEQMGGSCGVESTPGEGSRFWLEFAVPDEPPA